MELPPAIEVLSLSPDVLPTLPDWVPPLVVPPVAADAGDVPPVASATVVVAELLP
jgi:hypothetical protein